MPVLTITKVEPSPRQWEAKKGPAAGKKFLSYTVEAEDESGKAARYEISRKPESPPPELGPGEYTIEAASDSRFLPKLKKAQSGSWSGYGSGSPYRPPDSERSRRIERQHSQEMSLRLLAAAGSLPSLESAEHVRAAVKGWTDWFVQDLDVELGSSQAAHGASPNSPSVAEDAADLSAESSGATSPAGESPRAWSGVRRGGPSGDAVPPRAPEEASPAQKGTLTKLFHEAGLSREAMKAVVMFRCGQEKATKQGASQLITDLQDGATHDALLAEIYDAHRAGNPLGTRAAALIPTEVPWADDGSLPETPAKNEENIPF